MMVHALIISAAAFAARNECIYPLASAVGLVADYGITVNRAVYRGKPAVLLTEELDPAYGATATLAGSDFKDGTIDFDVAAQLTKNAPPGARGFVGIAFRGSDDMKRYDNFYLRMTNGRSPDQELRNHAVQYEMVPDHLWDELRQKRPFRYEAYTDLVLGEWTHVKIDVRGSEAKFYVGDAKQPTLVVHDLLSGNRHGKVALWVHAHTRGYFRNLVIRPLSVS